MQLNEMTNLVCRELSIRVGIVNGKNIICHVFDYDDSVLILNLCN